MGLLSLSQKVYIPTPWKPSPALTVVNLELLINRSNMQVQLGQSVTSFNTLKFILYRLSKAKSTSAAGCAAASIKDTNVIFHCPLPPVFAVLSLELYVIYLRTLRTAAYQLLSLTI